MTKVVVADHFVPEHIDYFRKELGEGYRVEQYEEEGSLADLMRDADIIVSYGRELTPEQLEGAQQVKLVVKLGTAKGKIAEESLLQRGIPLFTTESPALISVAEHEMMLMLALAKEVLYSDRGVRAGWNPLGAEEIQSTQLQISYNWLDLKKMDALYGKTVGIVGFGTVGQRLAKMAAGFQMKVIYYSRHRKDPGLEQQLNVEYKNLEDLLEESDFVAVNLKLNEETKGIFDRKAFQKMKPSAYFINTSRGPVVCEKDLCAALEAGEIAGAGIDVFEVEPLPQNSPLKQRENVVLTAHSAGIPLYKSLFTELKFCAQATKEFLESNRDSSIKN